MIHTYNLLAAQGDAAPLVCPDCNNKFISTIDVNSYESLPALYCLACNATTRPGLDFWDQIRAVVLEFYVLEQFQ